MIILIRAGVNLYFTILTSTGSTPAALSQISAGWYFYIAANIICCRSLSACHLYFALPAASFLNTAADGPSFKNLFIKYSVILRPMNIVFTAVILAGSLIFVVLGAGVLPVLSGLLQIIISLFLSAAVFSITIKLKIQQDEIRILESVVLLILMLLNPDVINKDGTVLMLYRGLTVHFESLPVMLIFICVVFTFICIAVSAAAFLSSISNKVNLLRLPNPVDSWYWKFFTVKYWLILYLFLIPLIFAPGIDSPLKRNFIIVFIIFTVFSYIIFINYCGNSIRFRLLSRFKESESFSLFRNSMLAHLILTLIPVTFFFIRK